MNFWLVVTSPENFKVDRESLGFKFQGLPLRYRKSVQKMQISDKVVYYIMTLQKFGATATVTGDYVEDYSKIWINDDEMWPARRPSEADLVLQDDELIDAKKLVPHLTFIENKEKWGVYLQGSIRQIPEEDFRFIESEMKKIIAERKQLAEPPKPPIESKKKTEKDYEAAIMGLPLEAKTLHKGSGRCLLFYYFNRMANGKELWGSGRMWDQDGEARNGTSINSKNFNSPAKPSASSKEKNSVNMVNTAPATGFWGYEETL